MSALMTATELFARLEDPLVRIADVRWTLGQPERGRDAYRAGHIPGAVFVDLDRDLAAAEPGKHPKGGRHPLPDPAAFARRMGELGFGTSHTIVAYDDTGGTIAARLWWMLDNLGHPDVHVLDGGLTGWLAAGYHVTAEEPDFPATEMHLRDRWSRTIDREALAGRLGALHLLDVRAGERYRGEVEPVDRVAGHIPTAHSAPTTANLGDGSRFLAPDALRERLRSVGADRADVVVACGSGVTAAHTALAMRLAGLPDPMLYPGSYSDWTAAEMPVVTGPEPGEP